MKIDEIKYLIQFAEKYKAEYPQDSSTTDFLIHELQTMLKSSNRNYSVDATRYLADLGTGSILLKEENRVAGLSNYSDEDLSKLQEFKMEERVHLLKLADSALSAMENKKFFGTLALAKAELQKAKENSMHRIPLEIRMKMLELPFSLPFYAEFNRLSAQEWNRKSDSVVDKLLSLFHLK